MTLNETLKKLQTLGTAQNRKVYARHGVTGAMYGVSYANLGKLKKTIKTDHPLALQLWSTGNHDARVLAAMIADPASMTATDLGSWVKDLDNHVIAAAFSGLASRNPSARKLMEKWTGSKEECVGGAGWSVLAHLASDDPDLSDGYLEKYLERIESTIHGSANRVRYSMNNALIAIGARNATLEKKAVSAARRIGPVEVDHGETGCKTPEAVSYIKKTVAHRKRKQARSHAG